MWSMERVATSCTSWTVRRVVISLVDGRATRWQIVRCVFASSQYVKLYGSIILVLQSLFLCAGLLDRLVYVLYSI